MLENLAALAALLKEFSVPLATVVIPLGVAFLGHRYAQVQKLRETQAHFVELAVDILKSNPVQGAEGVRAWAMEVVDKYSGVPLAASARSELEAHAIHPSAGNAAIEREIFSVASYGRQLGLITDVLIELAERSSPSTEDARESLQRLKALRETIESIKAARYEEEVLRHGPATRAGRRGSHQAPRRTA